jgi:uncharacterized phiE125 gp8 family phage protein
MYRVITPVTTEPISLAEVKKHLRIDSETFSGDITTTQSISPGSHNVVASYGLEGTSVDVLGKRAIINLNAGTCGESGKVDVKVQESDDNTEWDDWESFTQITEENDNATYEKEYTGTRQYIRTVSTVAASACSFGTNVITDSGGTSEDAQLSAWITAAREYAETYTGRAMATQTLEMAMDSFPCGIIALEMSPTQSVESIKYKNSSGTETTMTEDEDYLVDEDYGCVFLPYGKTWPVFTAYPVNPIRVRYVTGYNSEKPIPKALWAGMLVHVGLMYKYRDDEIPDAAMGSVKTLYAPYRVRWF